MSYSYEELAAALKATRGKITLAAEAVGCSRQTMHKRINEAPGLQEIVEHYRDRITDKAETGLENAIDNGEHWAIALALKTLGKDRGYVERSEVVSQNDIKLYGIEAPVDDV